MKKIQVWKYTCNFCRKVRYQAAAMEKHEKHCTLNPDRNCRMCDKLNGEGRPIRELIALLPDHANLPLFTEREGEAIPIINAALLVLREAADNCPICILAALRQAHIPVPLATDFDYDKERNAAFVEINKSACDSYGYG